MKASENASREFAKIVEDILGLVPSYFSTKFVLITKDRNRVDYSLDRWVFFVIIFFNDKIGLILRYLVYDNYFFMISAKTPINFWNR